MNRNVFRREMAVGAIVVAFLIVSIGSARSEEDVPPVDVADERLLFVEIPSVYGASRYEQKATEAPSSVSIVTAADFRKYGYRTLADILRSVRGFHVTYDRNYSYVGVRGFPPPGDYNTRILLLVDGHRINDFIYDQAPIGTEFPLDVDLIDRVEVIRGPSSSLYGGNAFFGVINVITRSARDLKGVEVSGEAASFGTFGERASWGGRHGGGLSALVSGTLYDSRGQRLYYPEFDNPATNSGIAEKADGDASRSAFAKLSAGDFTLDWLYHIRKKTIPTGSFGTVFNDPGTRTVDERHYADLKFERNLDSRTTLALQVYYDWYGYRGDYVLQDVLVNPVPPSHYVNKDDSVSAGWGGEVRVVRKVFGAHKVTAGAEVRDLTRQDQKNFNADPYSRILDDRRSGGTWALYAQDDFEIRKDLVLNAGVRHDHYRTFGGSTNPRIALIWSPLDNTVAKFLYGRAFRAPNAYEMFYNDGPVFQKANPGLGPEVIHTFETVLEQSIGNRIHMTATAYQYRIDGLITQGVDPTDNILVFRNAERIHARGAELELEGKFHGGYEGRAGYTVQRTKNNSTGGESKNSPRHMAKINLVIPLAAEKFFSGLELQYVGARKAKVGAAPAHLVTNATLFAQRLLNGLDVSASVYNVFDRKYGDPGGEEHLQVVIPQDGRSFRGKLTYRF